MSSTLKSEVVALIGDPKNFSVIATTDEAGEPHVTPSPFLQLSEDGRLIHLELLETSATNRNLLRSLWFNRQVAVTVVAADGRTFVVKGKTVKAVITGPVFSHYYQQVRAALGDVDLAAVWYIEPLEAINETHGERQAQEERQSPFYIHLDRLTVKESTPV